MLPLVLLLISAAAVVWVSAGYPLVLAALGRLHPQVRRVLAAPRPATGDTGQDDLANLTRVAATYGA